MFFLHFSAPVCFSVMEKFAATLSSDDLKSVKVIEDKFRKFCKTSKGKDHRLVSVSQYLWLTIVYCLISC